MFEPIPSRVFDYTLNVYRKGRPIDKKIFTGDFSFNATGSIGIDADNVKVIFSSDMVTVVIDDDVRPYPRRFEIQLYDD